MTQQTGYIVGKVEFRPGDGALIRIPKGPVEIDTTRLEATLSWVDGETHGAAAIPLNDFNRYVNKGAITLPLLSISERSEPCCQMPKALRSVRLTSIVPG